MSLGKIVKRSTSFSCMMFWYKHWKFPPHYSKPYDIDYAKQRFNLWKKLYKERIDYVSASELNSRLLNQHDTMEEGK